MRYVYRVIEKVIRRFGGCGVGFGLVFGWFLERGVCVRFRGGGLFVF